MQIGVLASAKMQTVWQLHASQNNVAFSWAQDIKENGDFDIFLDLNFDSFPNRIKEYVQNKRTIFLLKCNNIQLEKIFSENQLLNINSQIFGINAMPTFLERKILEVVNPLQLNISEIAIDKLGYEKIICVDSRAGMVSSRVVCMIINEAYFTLEEGTANKNDIDLGMKLGTNYPMGPFEWAEKIGLKEIVNFLDSMYTETHDGRYKVCGLLRTESYTEAN